MKEVLEKSRVRLGRRDVSRMCWSRRRRSDKEGGNVEAFSGTALLMTVEGTARTPSDRGCCQLLTGC